jgi:hypothetical protein
LLCPALAAAQSPYYGDDPRARGWLGVGIGGGTINSAAPAPSADHDAFSFTVDGGYRITPQWGLGLEFGMVTPNGGCGGHHCSSDSPDFAPDFSHWFLVGEHRPGDSGLRLRAGIGVTSMCYRYYRTRSSSFERFLEALLFYDEDEYYYYDDDRTHWDCKSLQALGGSVSVGYQWPFPDARSSVGLQLRLEAANFAASATAHTPAFHHRAVTLQLQMNIN